MQTRNSLFVKLAFLSGLCGAVLVTPGLTYAQSSADVEATRKARAERAAQLRAERAAKKGGAAPAEQPPPAADAEQLRTAERVLFGDYECELNQKLKVSLDAKYPGYVKVLAGTADFLMKPVASTTGAIRLEDVKRVGLLLQVAGKSMLMNTQSGQRVMDGCVHPEQREASK